MKVLLLITASIMFINCTNNTAKKNSEKDAANTSSDSLTVYDYTNGKVKVPLTPELKKNLHDTVEDCLDAYPVTAVDAPIHLPNPGRAVLLHDITNSSSFTVACESCGLSACVSGQWNPRYFNPKDNMIVWYGQCFSISRGNIRACHTTYGWRVEGDKDKDGKYEGVLKIIFQ